MAPVGMACTADRVVTRYRVFKAYTYAEALRLLGFPDGARPSDAEVQQAYRARVVEIRRTQGIDGGQQALKDINQAKDTLTGQFIPKGDPDDPTDRRHQQPPSSRPSEPYEPVDFDFGFGRKGPAPEPVRVSFEEAMQAAGVRQVDWKFKTETRTGGFGDTHSSGFVIYGQDGETHVFVAVQHHTERNAFTRVDIDTWWMRQERVQGELRTLAPRMIRELHEAFPDQVKNYNAKVQILEPGTLLTQRINYLSQRAVAFKDAMGIMGLIGEDDPWMNKGRPPRDIRIVLLDGHPDYGASLILDGRTYTLSAATYKALEKRGVLRKIFGAYYYAKSSKVITKMKNKGKDVLPLIVNALAGEPEELKAALQAAAASEAA